MRAGDQRRYHDILRREARPQTSKLCRGSAPVAAQLSGASLVCDPLAELNIPSTAVPEVVEYVCDRRGFTSLHPNFLRFEHLRCIVLEHNALETLHNLLLPPSTLGASSPASTVTAADGLPPLPPPPPLYRGCRQLTHLHAAYNRISDIAGDTDIPRLFLLEHLSLAHNQLTGLSKVLDALKRLRNLRFLDLRGNPVTGEPRYRERCIAALPQVEVLDRQSVTPKERKEAAAPVRWNGRTHESRLCSTATSTATAVSGSRPRSSPSCTRGLRAAGDPFSKSLTAKDLERAYAAYLRQQQQAQEAAAQSTVAAWRQQAEIWESFHAVWTLSQPGMPLSADGWQRTQMAAAAAASESAEGTGERPETQSTFLVSAPGFRVPVFGSAGPSPPSSPLHAGRKQIKTPSVSPAATTITAAPAPTHVSVGNGTAALNVTIDVLLDRPLFPSCAETAGTPESATLQPAAASTRSGPLPSAATATPLLPSVHNSLYFRAVRGASATSCKGTPPLLPTETSPPAVSQLLPVEGLAPDRLTTLQRTLEASAQVVRVATARQGSLGALKKLSVVQERVGSGRRNVAPSPPPPTVAAATSIPVEFSTLRTIQETKYAVIPPPWEDAKARAAVSGAKEAVARSPRAVVASLGATGASETTPFRIGVVSPATTQQEALTEILVLLHDVYSLKELQALEGEYGGAELLRLLPLREWSALGSESGAGEVVSTAVAARQAMTVLSHPDSVGNAAGGGGGNVRGPASQHDRKCFAASKGTAHRGNTRAGSAGSAAARGGGADAVGGVPTVAAALDAARAALHREPQLVWQLLTGPYMVAGATAGGNSGVVVALGKSSEDAGGSVSLIRKNSSSSAASTAPPTEAVISSSAGARANAAAASAPPVSLQDPEAVQHLVRPIGPYASHVLGPLLTLLRAPVAEEGVESMCDALAAHHAVHERTIAAASMLKATAAELQPRSSSVGPRSKKESLLVTEENGSAEAKSRKSSRGAAPAFLPDGGASTSLLPVSSAAGPQTRSSAKAAQLLVQQHSRQWVATQLTLTAVLTALLFSPAFVRSRVAYLEEKLARATSATAAASVITTADHAGQKGGGAAATLPLLFHRVQAVKMHAARVEAALTAAGPSATTSEALRLLDPAQVLVAYTGRR
ncbi:conserved hypothetical protein [Leishmania major strain Friedlin]|uniref:Leucine-rich repeat protein (LRRP) n=1 Tax=Leishmania major TaxID=5664 RepID=Q4Q9S0_LEIMA|nr:conserved hypothetical protein [Leishmania major strain Friedlin]CAG9575190.1 Leucine-rich_repeat/Leucine_Rich_repeats_(2_copies)_-_putative [Leishmania major strain Friedlin]CAJ05390.1 conserved hypothetical protein [Leishmania major strain Friedlin]|eukprot:XP_001683928.1 conserved hypothetical protein [Leishmania major strain Friedlin]